MEPRPVPLPRPRRLRLSRRRFLQVGGATVAAVGAAAALPSCAEDEAASAGVGPTGGGEGYSGAPPTPEHAPDGTVLQFFTAAEAKAMDALVARIVPGDAGDPGARECGVLQYVDHKMAAFDGGFAQGIYRAGPFAESGPAGTGAQGPVGGGGSLSSDQLARYGYQSSYNYREILRLGLAALDRAAGGPAFADLPTDAQDQLIAKVADGSAPGFDPPGATTFFKVVHEHVIEGMFCDPVYGGNRDLAGWELVGYPGAQRGYTPEYLHGDVPELAPQGLEQLHAFRAGRTDAGGAAVVSGQENGDEHGRYGGEGHRGHGG